MTRCEDGDERRRGWSPSGALMTILRLPGLRVDFEHVWGRGTLPADDDPGERREGEVLITVNGAPPLDWRPALAVRNHSPTGPAWGYGGSGPAQRWRWPSCWQCPTRRRRTAGRWTPATSLAGWSRRRARTKVVRLAVEES